MITDKTHFPFGTCVKTPSGYFFVRENGMLRMPSKRVVNSWSLNVVEVTDSAVNHLAILGTVGFRDGSLIQNFADGKVYLVAKNMRRHIVSPDALDKHGIYWDAVKVSQEEVDLHAEGPVLK